MKIKVFEFSTPYWSWGWRVSPQDVERALAQWASDNPNAQIRDIKHTTTHGRVMAPTAVADHDLL